MGFEINNGKEYLPPEEDMYGVNDIEEREQFEALLGMSGFDQETRFRRRKTAMVIVAVMLLLVFLLAFGGSELLQMIRQ